MLGNSRLWISFTTSRHSRLVSRMLALSTLVTRDCAVLKAMRAIRSISALVYTQSSEARSSVRVLAPK